MTTRPESLNESEYRSPHAGKPTGAGSRIAVVSAVLLATAALALPACQKNHQGATAPIEPGSMGAQLYQANCASCHGATGRGDGIAAVALDVKPRDFFNEPFRYVSSTDGVATDADLAQTIRLGRLGGEMPAGPWLTDEQTMALTNYVREINRQGWVERLENEFQGDDALDPDEIEEISWDRVTATEQFVTPTPSAAFSPDSGIGRRLFLQSCASCHGSSGTGDGLDEALLDELGATITVRDLTNDPIRGGDSPAELFKRIRAGIPGTPMPAQPGYSDDEIWQLVYYTRLLMGQPLLRSWQADFEQTLMNEGDF